MRIPVNRETLKKLINKAETKYEPKLDEYTSETAEIFLGVLNEARTIFVDEDATQAEIDAAYTNLQNAIFGLRLIPSKDKLDDLINRVENMNLSMYTAESVEAVKAMLGEAKAVFENEDATQEEIDKAVERLRKSVDELKVAKAEQGDSDRISSTNKDDNSKKAAKTGDAGAVIPATVALVAILAVLTVRKKR